MVDRELIAAILTAGMLPPCRFRAAVKCCGLIPLSVTKALAPQSGREHEHKPFVVEGHGAEL